MSFPINEAVGLLARVSPGKLDELVKLYPHIEEELKPGIIAGVKPSHILARFNIHKIALTSAIDDGLKIKSELIERIKKSRKLKISSSIVTCIGSASVLASITAEMSWFGYISGSVTLVGSIFGLYVAFKEEIPSGKYTSTTEAYSVVNKALHTAKLVLEEIKFALNTEISDLDESRLKDLIGESNQLCGELNQLSNIFLIN